MTPNPKFIKCARRFIEIRVRVLHDGDLKKRVPDLRFFQIGAEIYPNPSRDFSEPQPRFFKTEPRFVKTDPRFFQTGAEIILKRNR